MKGDRERCLAAGMDGYVSKPIQARQLLGVMREVLAASAPALPVAPSQHKPSPLDPAAILERLGGDAEMLREVAELFRQDAAQLLVDLEDALACGDAPRIKRSAHSLKGSAGLFAAEEVTATAQELENLGESGDLTSGRVVFERLTPQVAGASFPPWPLSKRAEADSSARADEKHPCPVSVSRFPFPSFPVSARNLTPVPAEQV